MMRDEDPRSPACVRRLRIAEALDRIPDPDGRRFVELFRHGTLSVELYAPRGADLQEPHARDEVYVVASGRGLFVGGGRSLPFEAGDLLFAPAGLAHRFEEFTDDLAVWVLFYGPEGGEA